MKNKKKILVIQTAFIGDVILTLPLIEAVHRKYSGSHISLIITPKAYDLVKANPYINDVIIYDKNGKDRGFKNFIKIDKKIKIKKYDMAILPHRSMRSVMLAYSGGIPERIGFNRSVGKMFLTKVVKYSWNKHEIERNLSLIDEENISKRIPIFLDAKDVKSADKFLKEKGIKKNDIIIGIAPGSVWSTKRWVKERFAELSKRLIDAYSAKIILFGGKEDEALCVEIKKITGKEIVVGAGILSLGESASVISKCDLFITNDTAPLHMASAFQIPTVAIFGPTTTDLGFGSYSEFNIVAEKKMSCRPCGRHGHRECPKEHFKCMNEIATDEVFEACRRLLK